MVLALLVFACALVLGFTAVRSRRTHAAARSWLARWWRSALAGVGALCCLCAALLLSTFDASPLALPTPFAGALPSASPPPELAIYQLPTGVVNRSAAFAYRGGSFFDARVFSMTAVLVRHPRGDVLIDTGFGRDIDRHFAMMPWILRATTRYTRLGSARQQLDAAHYDLRNLRAVLLTHAHWDHVSGAGEFPETPVWVTAEEHRYVRDGASLTAVARATGARFEEYRFDGGSYLGFRASHDVHGDGSIVVVPAPGHTPGSVIVFVALPTGVRYAFVGDLAWQREGITEREERPWLQRTMADDDPAEVRAALLHMDAIALRWPSMVLVPAHDARAFVGIPRLPQGGR